MSCFAVRGCTPSRQRIKRAWRRWRLKQVELELARLRARQRLVRQEEITAEVIELAAGEAASQWGSLSAIRRQH
jgi:hypothetical protein